MVACVERQTGLRLAAKYVKITCKEDRRNMEREIEIMSGLHHPRIVQLYDAYDKKDTIICVLELYVDLNCLSIESFDSMSLFRRIQGGELFDRVIEEDYQLTEKACTVFVRQICEAVDFLQSRNILHLDLKPENVLCLSQEGNRIKIIDFGMARTYDPAKKLQVLFGTPEFVGRRPQFSLASPSSHACLLAAPEIVNFEEINFYTDMWSIGVICYVLLSGLSPFMGETDVDTMTNVTLGKYNFDDDAFSSVSENAKDFIGKLLQKESR